MGVGLEHLFAMMDKGGAGTSMAGLGDCVNTGGNQGDLFSDGPNESTWDMVETDIPVIAALFSNAGIDLSILPFNARRIFELSINAFDTIMSAWMSELPITAEIIRYGQRVIAAACIAPDGCGGEAQRKAADAAATDRGSLDARTVLDAAYKAWHEIHRLMGLLRFCPDGHGVYIARCEPDHFILPALGPHFSGRFGCQPWVIIDVKRRISMGCSGGPLAFGSVDTYHAIVQNPPGGEWENLWRRYHKTINNESRNNPELQRRFMPRRYWKYLTELDHSRE